MIILTIGLVMIYLVMIMLIHGHGGIISRLMVSVLITQMIFALNQSFSIDDQLSLFDGTIGITGEMIGYEMIILGIGIGLFSDHEVVRGLWWTTFSSVFTIYHYE